MKDIKEYFDKMHRSKMSDIYLNFDHYFNGSNIEKSFTKVKDCNHNNLYEIKTIIKKRGNIFNFKGYIVFNTKLKLYFDDIIENIVNNVTILNSVLYIDYDNSSFFSFKDKLYVYNSNIRFSKLSVNKISKIFNSTIKVNNIHIEDSYIYNSLINSTKDSYISVNSSVLNYSKLLISCNNLKLIDVNIEKSKFVMNNNDFTLRNSCVKRSKFNIINKDARISNLYITHCNLNILDNFCNINILSNLPNLSHEPDSNHVMNLNINTLNRLRTFNNFGSHPSRGLVFYRDCKSGIPMVITGCFRGTIKDFIESVDKTHSKNEAIHESYSSLIDYLISIKHLI